jgi:hypothetical protein
MAGRLLSAYIRALPEWEREGARLEFGIVAVEVIREKGAK